MTTADPSVQRAASPAKVASQRVADYLRTAILSGAIGPGDWIRQEEIAERLQASRLPVREALRMLEAEGLTELEANRGARVPVLDQYQVDLLYQMRERLEPLALTESMPHLSDAQLRELERLVERIEANTDLGEFIELDRAFHLLSYTGCTMQQLTSGVARLWNSTQHYRRLFMTVIGPERRWVVNAEHRLLLDAICRRDAVDAERYLTGHIRRTRVELSHHGDVFTATQRR